MLQDIRRIQHLDKKYLCLKEVADYLNLSRREVKKLIDTNKLSGTFKGRSYLISKVKVLQYLKKIYLKGSHSK